MTEHRFSENKCDETGLGKKKKTRHRRFQRFHASRKVFLIFPMHLHRFLCFFSQISKQAARQATSSTDFLVSNTKSPQSSSIAQDIQVKDRPSVNTCTGSKGHY